ncbi:cyanophycin synthetase [Chitinimonas sp. BJYL2]|uniref:cyanophycin synthetase n=1 Tax=Chitinimonas sp. BJYL2 TaxID=2976696 RepID=UPI0022B3B132|nr:cyanophycin synthetase [Chitinimonas sp. BJYL2]
MKKAIEFLRTTYLRGPNIWTYRPVIEAWVDLGELEDFPSNTLPGFFERLTGMLPGLIEHHCGVGERGGFLERLQEGTWMGHIMEHVAIELNNLAGLQTGFGQTRSTPVRGVYKVAVRARNEQVGRAAIVAARDIVMAAINDQPFDIDHTVQQLRDLVDDHHLGPSTACIVAAATERRIPHIRLNEGNLVQLGHGKAQRRIWTAETDRTSAIAEGISSDKDLTKSLLKSVGVPVPEGEVVDSPEAAWAAAEDIGLPVVVKPTDGNHGRGVSMDLKTREDVEKAFEFAARHGSEVMVERCIPGVEHRLLVVGGKVAAAARGETAWVVADGVATLRALVDAQINSDPRRGTTELHPLARLNLDDDTAIRNELARQGYTPDSVPAAGQRVLIQRNGNVAFECTPEVHPEVAAMVGLAARTVGLDIAGVDVVAEDISKPLHAQGAAIVEVNAGPGLLMHLRPANGEPRPVGAAIIDHLFPADASGRIPLVGVTGSTGTTRVARLISSLLLMAGRHVGLACRDGLFLDRRRIDAGDASRWDAGQRILINRKIDTAVFEHHPAGILGDGLPYDRCQVGVVTDADGLAGLADWHVVEPDHLYKVLRTQVDVVDESGLAVLHAAEPMLVEMADLCDGAVVLYALDGQLPALAAHRADGGRVLFAREGQIVLADGAQEQIIAPLPGESDTGDAAGTLAAVAVATYFGVSPALIAAGLEAGLGMSRA